MASGGGRVGSGNPVTIVTLLGDPLGGPMAGGTTTVLPAIWIAPADASPPSGTVSVNGGAAYTKTPVVSLTLAASDPGGVVTRMKLSNDGVAYTAPEPFASSKAWTLPSGDGGKTVSVMYQDAAGNWSQPASATIILDTAAPAIQAPRVTAVTDRSASIAWTTDEPSGGQVAYGLASAHESLSPADAAPTTAKTVTLGGLQPKTGYRYCVYATDRAGNTSTSPELLLTTAPPPAPDTTAPTGSLTINGGAEATKIAAVSLAISASDDSGAVSQMQLSPDGVTYAAPEPYAAARPWTLAGPDGLRSVYVKVADAAGNWSGPMSDTIRLDTVPLVVSITSPNDGEVLGPHNVSD